MKRKRFLTFVTLCIAALFVSLSFIRNNDISYAHSLFLIENSENVSYLTNTYYIDCQASSNGNGSVTMPWNNLNEINSRTFVPADQILLKRSTVCAGNIDLKGSGTQGNSIVLSSYGEGNRPVVKTTAAVQAAIRLFNEEYWTIEHLETTGGNQYGIYVGGDLSNRVLRNININDVFVHNVNGPPRWDSGLIVVAPNGEHLTFENVVIENSVVNNFENSTQGNAWWGIHVGFNPTYGNIYLSDRSRSVTVRNCNVQNTYGDSITFALVNDGLIESNISKRSGLAPEGISYTPNAIWMWDSDNIVVQFNEGSESYSFAVDGGIFDADKGSTNITFQYNYAHNAQGYCLGLFAGDRPTVNIVFRYNLCIGNDLGGYGSGEIELYSWNGGYFDGVQIYNNTFVRNAGNSGEALIWARPAFGGSRPNIVFNNIFYSTSPRMIEFTPPYVNSPFVLKNNIYWYSGSGNPEWIYGNSTSYSLQAHQANSGQDQGSIFANPLLPNPNYGGNTNGAATAFLPATGSPAYNRGIAALANMGVRDFAGTLVPQDNIYDIGALERTAVAPQPTPTPTPTLTPTPTPNPTPSPSPTVTPTPGVYTLVVSSTNVIVGSQLTVNWTAPANSSAYDWVALFQVGAPLGAYGAWTYTNGATSGSFTINAPSQAGLYEFRYILSDNITTVKTSSTITVSAVSTPTPTPTATPTPNVTPTPSPTPTPVNSYTLIASPDNVKAGRPVTVSWTAPPGSSGVDWIALYMVGAPNTSYGWRQYTNGATSGSFTVTMPMQIGQYEFRYLLNNGYQSVKTSNVIRVKR